MTGQPDTQAHERTILAWSRTAVGSLVVTGLLIRFAERGRAPVAGELAALLALLLAVWTWGASRRRRERERYERLAMFGLAAGVTAVAGAAIIAIGLALA